MPFSPNRSYLSATAAVAVTALVSLMTGAGASAQSTLDLPLETEPPAARPASAPAKNPSAGVSKAPRLPSLSSRGGAGRTSVRTPPKPPLSGAPKVLAQLAVVLRDKLEVWNTLGPKAKQVSTVEQGTHLAVVREAPQHWGILMSNNMVGWISKDGVRMIDYQTEVALNMPEESAESNAPSLDPVRQHILEEAFTYLGVPYVWAGNTRRGLDCSAFVKNVFSTVGVKLPRHSGHQISVGVPVEGQDAELRPGDRLYFDMKRSGRISHTGIYIGNGMFIHASTNQGKVGVDKLTAGNYMKCLVAIRRDFE
ncbi:MAG: hypothetical protein OHK0029_32380 [Armatimonadaceae bacterium]